MMTGEEIYWWIAMGVAFVVGVVLPGAYLCYALVQVFRKLVLKRPVRLTGVALISSIIVCLIIIAGALPNFFKFSSPPKQGDAKNILRQLYELEMAYRAEHGEFAGGPNALRIIDFEYGPSRYAYGCGGDFVPNAKGDPVPRTAVPADAVISRDSFTCFAVGNIDSDPDLDYWIINDAKMIQNLPSSDL